MSLYFHKLSVACVPSIETSPRPQFQDTPSESSDAESSDSSTAEEEEEDWESGEFNSMNGVMYVSK